MRLGEIFLTAFLIVLLLRWWLEKKYVLKQPEVDQHRYQFILDLVLSLLVGLLVSAYNTLVYHFPLFSSVKLIIGVSVTGFFLSLDMALTRERLVILEAMNQDRPAPPLRKLYPMSRTFAWIALLTALCLVLVLGLILVKDLDWITTMSATPESRAVAKWSVTKEILYVIAILMLMVMNVIFSYSRNLKLLFASQTQVLLQVSNGDFSRKVPVASPNEFGLIAQFTNLMIEGLKHRIKLLGALKVAEEVQRGLLPTHPPQVQGLEIAAVSIYSEYTGGDYYDFIKRPDNSLAIVVGDVSGHGVASALLMASARAFLHVALSQNLEMDLAVAEVNGRLARDVEESGRFLTLFVVAVDPETRTISWVRGGHDPAFLYDPAADGFEPLEGQGVALGLFEEAGFEIRTLKDWSPGTIITIGTDGIWEAHNAHGEMFGKQRLKDIIRSQAAAPPQKALEAVLSSVAEFRGQASQEDDVTLVLIKLN